MSATFDPTLSTAKDRLRAALGDRDMTAPLRTDEEYVAQLGLIPDERLATATMAEGLAAEYASQPTSISGDDGTITWNARVSTWLALAKALRAAIASDVSAARSGFGSMRAVRDCNPHSQYSRDRRRVRRADWGAE